MEVGGLQNPISVLSDTEPEVLAGLSTLIPVEDPVPVPAPEDSRGAPQGVVGVQCARRGRRTHYPHTIQLGRRPFLVPRRSHDDVEGSDTSSGSGPPWGVRF